MESTTSMVTLSLEEYNALRDENESLKAKNEHLADVIEQTKDMDSTRVIIKEVFFGKDEDGDDCKFIKYSCKNFDDVREHVADIMKEDIESSKERIEQLQKDSDARNKALDELKEKSLELQTRAEKLLNRNWWQRLFNK